MGAVALGRERARALQVRMPFNRACASGEHALRASVPFRRACAAGERALQQASARFAEAAAHEQLIAWGTLRLRLPHDASLQQPEAWGHTS
jgi:hypothetical protein